MRPWQHSVFQAYFETPDKRMAREKQFSAKFITVILKNMPALVDIGFQLLFSTKMPQKDELQALLLVPRKMCKRLLAAAVDLLLSPRILSLKNACNWSAFTPLTEQVSPVTEQNNRKHVKPSFKIVCSYKAALSSPWKDFRCLFSPGCTAGMKGGK